MDKKLAEYVAGVAFKSSSSLSRLIPVLKENLDENEYEEFRKAITKSVSIVGTEILFKIFNDYPEIDKCFKETIERYGRLP